MIKITIDSKEVDLPSDFCFEYTEENMLMEENTLPVPFTTSIEFPLKKSLRNQSIFRHKHRVTSIITDLTYKCIVYVDGFVLVDGWYIVESMGDVVSGELKMVNPTNDLDKPIDKFDWPKIYIGNALRVWYRPALTSFYWRLNEVFENLSTYLLQIGQPVRNAYIRIKSIRTQSASSVSQWSMFCGAKTSDDSYFYEDPYRHSGHMYPVLPALDFGVVMKTILGDNTLENPILSFINDEDMRLFCQTVTAPGFVEGRTTAPYVEIGEQYEGDYFKAYFNIANFMPSTPASDFIKAAINLFCCSIYFDKGNVYIKRNKDILMGGSYVDLSNFPLKYVSTSINKSKTYVCGYENLEGTPDGIEPTEVNLFNDIILAGREGEDDHFRDRFGNIWERKKINDLTEGWSYDCIWSRLHRKELTDEDNIFSKTTSLTPMLYSSYNQWTPLSLYYADSQWPHTPSGDRDPLLYRSVITSCLDSIGTKDDMFKIGFLNDYNNVFSYDNIGIDDLIRKYHREYKDWIEKDKKLVTVDMLIPASELFKMQLWNKVYFQGRMFLIKKRTMRFYMDFIDLTTLELVECQCPLITEEPT